MSAVMLLPQKKAASQMMDACLSSFNRQTGGTFVLILMEHVCKDAFEYG